MSKLGWLILLVAGVALLIYAVHTSDSEGSFFSRIVTGVGTAKTMALLILGFIATLVGLAGVLRSRGS
jgi:hypothetical protein